MSAPEPVVLVPYDPAWHLRFEEERARLAHALGPLALDVQHVGSTALPGMPAKPLLDLAVGLARLDDAPAAAPALERLGYAPLFGPHTGLRDRHVLVKGAPRTHQLHVVELAGDEWRRMVGFRDWMRTHPDDARRYAALKEELAAHHRDDRAAYAAAKTPFVRAILAKAGLPDMG